MRLQGGRLFGAGLAALAATTTVVGVLGVTPANAGTLSSVVVSPSSAAGSAKGVAWTIDLNSQSALASGTDKIIVAAPAGTVFAPWNGNYTVTDDTTDLTKAAGTVVLSNSNATATVTMPISTAAGDDLTLQIRNVTNPASGASQHISVTTTQDTASDVLVSFVAAVAPTLNSFTPSTTAGGATQATWDFDMNTSATNGALWPIYGTFVVSDGSGTSAFSTKTADYTVNDLTTGTSKIASHVAVSSDSVTVTTGIPVGAGDEVLLELRGVTNSASSTNYNTNIQVSTSSDLSPATPASGSFGSAGAVTYDSLWTSTLAAGATKATWTATYHTSSTGALWPGHGNMTLTLAGATFTNNRNFYTITDTTTGASAIPTAVASSSGSVTLTTAISISGGDRVLVQARSVTNPGSTGAVSTTLGTSSDGTDSTPGSAPTLASAQAVGGSPSFVASTPAVSATRVTWTFRETASPNGRLWAGQGAFVVALPAAASNAAFSSSAADYTITDRTSGQSGTPSAVARTVWSASVGAKTVITTPFTINPGDQVVLRVRNVTNPSTTTAFSAISFSTTSDTTTATLSVGPGTGFVANHPLGAWTLSPVPATGGSTNAVWTINTTTSATGALWAGYGQITLTMPAGTFSTNAANYSITYAGTTLTAKAVSVSLSSGTEKVVITVPMWIGNNGAVTLVVHGVTNPPVGKSYSLLSMGTSSDTSVGTSTSGTF